MRQSPMLVLKDVASKRVFSDLRQDWNQQWRATSEAVVSPATLLVLISTLILGWVAINQGDGLMAAIFTLGTSVAAGILGAVIWDR